MHVVILVLTLFFYDNTKVPVTVTLTAPSMAVCVDKSPALKLQILAAKAEVRDVAMVCVDQVRRDNA
jgi:hypothetical protein